MGISFRLCAALAPLILLSACLLTPGKFESTLDIRKNGAFTFAYKGEIIAEDFEGLKEPEKGMDAEQDEAGYTRIASDDEDERKAKATKLRAIADALAKEKGFRSVKIAGEDMLEIDYEITGILDHGFVFPFNTDAEAVFPFVAIEVRNDGKVRVRAPGFGKADDKTGMAKGGAERRNGTFTLTTDATIVSQNQEDGASETPKGKQIVWQITPLTSVAPMAVLQLAGEGAN